MILTKSLYQEKDNPFQALEIIVRYCKKTRIAEEIVSVTAYEFGKDRIDVTEIFMNYFETDLNKLVDETDWTEIYAETVIAMNEMIDE